MKNVALITVSLFALGLGSCGKTSNSAAPDAAMSGMDTSSSSATNAMPAASAGQTFADTAAASDSFEIATSKLAATHAASAKVKQFAEQMIKAHTDSTAKLKAAAAGATPAIKPSPTLTAAQQQTVDALGTKKGADFDKAYTSAQVDAHSQTLDALKAYSASGDVPSLKAFARSIVPTVTAHLNMAKAL